MKTYSLANPLQHGEDLKLLQKALAAPKLYRGPIDGIFGAGTADACKQAKYRLGYPARALLRTGGQTLLDFLNGMKPLPLTYRLRRHARGFGLSREDKIRNQIVWWAHWGVTNEPSIHYSMGGSRDDWLHYSPGALPLTTDCSGFVTACYRWAGARDPSRLDYREVGYTGTLLDNGETIPVWQAKPGDLVIWGAFPGHHVAVIVSMKNPADPLLVSHGREAGPNVVSLAVETSAQRRSYVVKRYGL